MTNFRALNTLIVYSNIFKIRLLIHIIPCRNTRMQIDLSNNNHFSLEEAINYIPHTEKRKKVPACEMFEFSGSLSFSMHLILSRKLKIIAYRGSSTIPTSFKLELFCQYEMTSIVTKISITDDLGTEIRLWFLCFLCKTLLKRLKLNSTKSTFTCSKLKFGALEQGQKNNYAPKLIIKSPKQC